MSSSPHTSRLYEQELRNLREKLLLMGSLVEEMIARGARALVTRDTVLAQSTMKLDRRINRLECEVDEQAMRILATRQPVASDLRFLTTALKIVTDLERIGDLCVNICDRVIELNEEPPLGPSSSGEVGGTATSTRTLIPDLESLAEEATAVVHDALDALVSRDVAQARKLLARDDGIDAHYGRIFKEVLDLMAREPRSVYRATRVQSIAKYLERIADHAMNVAESVVFLVEGTDIRHVNRKQDADSVPPPRVKPTT